MGAVFAIFLVPMIGTIFILWFAFIILYAIVRFITYIFESFGLLRIAKKEKYKIPYLVWVPGFSHYVLARYCTDKTKSFIYSILAIINIPVTIFLLIQNIGAEPWLIIYGIVYFIIDMLVMNTFYKKVYKTPELFTITTIITFGLLKPIFIYTSRIKKITKVNL